MCVLLQALVIDSRSAEMQPGESFGLSAAELGAESLGDDGSAAPGCSPWTASALTA